MRSMCGARQSLPILNSNTCSGRWLRNVQHQGLTSAISLSGESCQEIPSYHRICLGYIFLRYPGACKPVSICAISQDRGGGEKKYSEDFVQNA